MDGNIGTTPKGLDKLAMGQRSATLGNLNSNIGELYTPKGLDKLAQGQRRKFKQQHRELPRRGWIN